MDRHLKNALKFCELLNRFRLVDRAIYANGKDRMENDVEHSYQLAMVAWYIASSRGLDLDSDLVIKYALVHDLVEVYAGDTDVFSKDQAYVGSKAEREEAARDRMKGEFPEFSELHDLVRAYELRHDPESQFVYALDGIHPVFNVYLDNGRFYRDHGISAEMVRQKRGLKAAESPEAKEYFDGILRWLRNMEDGSVAPEASLSSPEDLRLSRALEFSDLLNRFRLVERVVYINDKNRWENDIEHSYQLAMLAWYIASSRKLDFDLDLLIKYALVHDLVEVYAGDTYFYSTDKSHVESKEIREHEALERIREEFWDFPDLYEAMVNYEKKADLESRFVYALDKIHPMINIYMCGSQLFKEKEVTSEMLYDNKRDKVALSPEVKPYFDELMRILCEEGLLFDSKQ
jgi:putative hydrolase of HD superfamily